MKTIRLNAAFLAACAVCAFFPVPHSSAWTQPANQMLAIGDTNTMNAYAVNRIWGLHITIWGSDSTGNQVIAGWVDDRGLKFDTIETSMSYYQNRLQFALNQALTNRNPRIDLSKPCSLLATYNNNVYLGGTWAYYGTSPTFSYPVNVSGQYVLPDLKQFNMSMSGDFVCVVPGIEWAICETFLRSNGARVALWDSRTNSTWAHYSIYDPNGGVDVSCHWFILRSVYAADNLTYSNRIEIVTTNGYYTLDQNGFIRPETPVVLQRPLVTATGYRVTFSGGDPGRVLTLQTSADMKTWINSDVATNGYCGALPRFRTGTGNSFQPPLNQNFFRMKLSY